MQFMLKWKDMFKSIEKSEQLFQEKRAGLNKTEAVKSFVRSKNYSVSDNRIEKFWRDADAFGAIKIESVGNKKIVLLSEKAKNTLKYLNKAEEGGEK